MRWVENGAGWWSLMRQALKLDVWDLTYMYGSQRVFQRLGQLDAACRPRRGVALRLAAHVWRFKKSLKKCGASRRMRVAPRSVCLFAFSINQAASLSPIAKALPDAYLMGEAAGVLPVPFLAQAYSLSFLFLPVVCANYLRSKGYRKEAANYILDQHLLAYGYYMAARLWFRRALPSVVVLSNDHLMTHRVLATAARHEGVPTVYVQHASVTDEFPPLSFDYALLDGYDALRVYDAAGPSDAKVFLVGMAKFDRYASSVNTRRAARAVGVCTNVLDPLERVEELCSELTARLQGVSLILRPHPADKRTDVWKSLSGRYGLELSDSRAEASFDFLRRIDVLVAGNSNIQLEAALLDVYPIYFDYAQDSQLQKYSFVDSGLCEYIADASAVVRRLEVLQGDKPSVRQKARLYCATVGTAYDGRSCELAARLLQEIAAGGTPDLSRWRRVPGVGLEAYQLSDGSGEYGQAPALSALAAR